MYRTCKLLPITQKRKNGRKERNALKIQQNNKKENTKDNGSDIINAILVILPHQKLKQDKKKKIPGHSNMKLSVYIYLQNYR